MERMELKIDGMSCGHCVQAVRKALEGVAGIQVQEVEMGSALIGFDPEQVSAVRIRSVLGEEGYELLATERLR